MTNNTLIKIMEHNIKNLMEEVVSEHLQQNKYNTEMVNLINHYKELYEKFAWKPFESYEELDEYMKQNGYKYISEDEIPATRTYQNQKGENYVFYDVDRGDFTPIFIDQILSEKLDKYCQAEETNNLFLPVLSNKLGELMDIHYEITEPDENRFYEKLFEGKTFQQVEGDRCLHSSEKTIFEYLNRQCKFLTEPKFIVTKFHQDIKKSLDEVVNRFKKAGRDVDVYYGQVNNISGIQTYCNTGKEYNVNETDIFFDKIDFKIDGKIYSKDETKEYSITETGPLITYYRWNSKQFTPENPSIQTFRTLHETKYAVAKLADIGIDAEIQKLTATEKEYNKLKFNRTEKIKPVTPPTLNTEVIGWYQKEYPEDSWFDEEKDRKNICFKDLQKVCGLIYGNPIIRDRILDGLSSASGISYTDLKVSYTGRTNDFDKYQHVINKLQNKMNKSRSSEMLKPKVQSPSRDNSLQM